MSTCLGLFYTKRLVNCIHCTLIFIFFCVVVSQDLFLFAQSLIRCEHLLKKPTWPLEKTCTTTLGQRGPGSNGNKEVVHTPRAPDAV